MNGTVGIVTRTKNRHVLLKRAMESVLSQSHPHWIQIIVNDGGDPQPVDKLFAAYRESASGRIRVIHHPVSLGMEAASNVGIRAILDEIDYLVIHDDDDTWSPEFLTVAVSELEDAHARFPRVKGVITMANTVFERIDGHMVTIDHVEEFLPWVNRGLVSFDEMFHQCQYAPIQFLYKVDALKDTGLYRDDLAVLGDWDFNLRFLRHYDIMIVPQVLAFYHHRVHEAGSAYSNTVHGARDKHDFYRQMLKNEWLRQDLTAGAASFGELANLRPHYAQTMWNLNERAVKGIEQIHGSLHDISNRLHNLEVRRHPIRNTARLVTLWLKSGRPMHYFGRFFESLSQHGLAETIETVGLWFKTKKSEL